MKIAPYFLAAGLIAAPAAAHDDEKCQVSMEYSSVGTWYSENGPRPNFECRHGDNSVSGVYLPMGNDGTGAHDAHINAGFKTGGLKTNLILIRSEEFGYGGALIMEKSVGKDASVLSRLVAHDRGLRVGELKFLSRHVDLAFGIRKLREKESPFGYVTLNGGRWDDTFTVGYDTKDRLWQMVSAERERNGVIEFAYYQPKTGDWGFDTYMGRDGLNRGWFVRSIDRKLGNNLISPKPRTFIFSFPSYLALGDKAAEIRAERTDGKTFAIVSAGRKVNIGKVRIGAGIGVEYEKTADNAGWSPAEEIYAETSVFGCHIYAQYRFRRNEGGFHAAVSKKF